MAECRQRLYTTVICTQYISELVVIYLEQMVCVDADIETKKTIVNDVLSNCPSLKCVTQPSLMKTSIQKISYTFTHSRNHIL